MSNITELKSDLVRYLRVIDDLRKRNGVLMVALSESAPHRIGDLGEILSLAESDRIQRGMAKCRKCGAEFKGEYANGINCPDCRK